ncbi:MAG: OsmC family protein [Bacteroidetes bacterium]|nr:OsmC family protein [Bacteroidota bacterium]
MSDLTFSIKGESKNATKFEAAARNFKIIIDEPPALGGADHGPNPVEYLLASYAGCLNVMGHLLATELGFNLEKLEIEVTGDINPDRLFGKSFDERAGFKGINVALKPYADATPEQLQTWIQAVESRCPVNDNLNNLTPTRIALLN